MIVNDDSKRVSARLRSIVYAETSRCTRLRHVRRAAVTRRGRRTVAISGAVRAASLVVLGGGRVWLALPRRGYAQSRAVLASFSRRQQSYARPERRVAGRLAAHHARSQPAARLDGAMCAATTPRTSGSSCGCAAGVEQRALRARRVARRKRRAPRPAPPLPLLLVPGSARYRSSFLRLVTRHHGQLRARHRLSAVARPARRSRAGVAGG